jgi:hypothetical protein
MGQMDLRDLRQVIHINQMIIALARSLV